MPDWVIQLCGFAAAGAGIYAGIRYDLGRLHEGVRHAAEAASKAHQRIDGLLIAQRGMHG